MKNTEIEFKWDANEPRAFARMEKAVKQIDVCIKTKQKIYICDVYVDTPQHDFEKQKIAMRIRQTGKHWQATFKTRTEVIGGKAVRREETCNLTGVKNIRGALVALQKKKIWCGLQVAQLHPIFKLTNHRNIQLLQGKGLQAELALDTCKLLVHGRQLLFKEIELELKRGEASKLDKLAGELTRMSGLKPARVSKVQTAVALWKLWEEK
ncbi:MAG: CYTH domain-containing protein [Elusimicrobiaceae bacterium]|nr:CYTH domain-containing protein [Elusimicrobiaceae bacterium]